MLEPPTYEDLQQQVNAAIESLEAGDGSHEGITGLARREGVDPLAVALRTTLLALSASLGECRQQTPFSPLHPVLGKDGQLRWCCNHAKQHCSV